MGYTATDTVSCRLLPEQIAKLRQLAASEGVSLARYMSGLCLGAIQGHERDQTSTPSSGTHDSRITRENEVARLLE
jgi:hypothetical protein